MAPYAAGTCMLAPRPPVVPTLLRARACSLGRVQKRASNSSNFEGVYVLHELEVPDARRIIELEALTNGGLRREAAACWPVR